MAKKKNRNIVLLKTTQDLQNEIDYTDFEYQQYFSHICNLLPNTEKEKLEIEILDQNKAPAHIKQGSKVT